LESPACPCPLFSSLSLHPTSLPPFLPPAHLFLSTEPHKDQITGLTVSWIYPVIILVILSFPPLGGHEIVLLVVGLIWGLWIGFAIACAGTLIGEVRRYASFPL
jgi:hypothetical protein